MFFAFGGAAIETALSGGLQPRPVRRLALGPDKRPREAPRFALAWIVVFVLATALSC